MNDGHFHRCKWLIDHAMNMGEGIIDIGCADGFMFRDKDLDVVEVDLNYHFPPRYRGKVKFVMADSHCLPFRDGSFQCAIMGDLLEHVDDPVKCIREAKRVADKIYVTVPNEHSWGEEKRPFQHADHKRFYTAEAVARDFRLAGSLPVIHRMDGGGWSFFLVEVTQ